METVIDDVSMEIEQHSTTILLCYFCCKQITKAKQQDADSLCNHHITYIPEVIVPSHRGCHIKYHKTHPTHPKNPEFEYRKRLIEGDDNILCYFCGKQVNKMIGHDSVSLLIHSFDGNHNNWDKDNKVPTHRGCHTRYHVMCRDVSEETRRKMGRAKEGDINPMKDPEIPAKAWKVKRDRYTPEEISEIGERGWVTRRERYGRSGCVGEHHTKRPEVRKKISNANRGNSQIGIEAWKTRRERYGPSGYKDPENAWKRRRELYGPTGMKSRSQVM